MAKALTHSMFRAGSQLLFSILILFAALMLLASTPGDRIAHSQGARFLIGSISILPFLLAIAATVVLTTRRKDKWHFGWLVYLCAYSIVYYFLHPSAGYLAENYLGLEILGILFVVTAGIFNHLVLLVYWTVLLMERRNP